MTALAAGRPISEARWTTHKFTLTATKKAWRNGAACIDLTTGNVLPATPSTTLKYIGVFAEDVDATSGALPVLVNLIDEIALLWFANSGASDAVVAANIGSDCYFIDDQTVGTSRAGRSVAGTIWGVDAVKGVLVQKSNGINALAGTGPALPAYASNIASPTDIVNGAFYDVPTTAAASQIVLPAAAADGTRAYFLADGTKNGNTVQYVDATGSVNLTTALTASKRHLVEVTKFLGKWFANAYVSP